MERKKGGGDSEKQNGFFHGPNMTTEILLLLSRARKMKALSARCPRQTSRGEGMSGRVANSGKATITMPKRLNTADSRVCETGL